MKHPRNGEHPIKVFHLQLRVVLCEVTDGLVVVQRRGGSDEVVRPPNIMYELSVVGGASERREIRFVCLYTQAR